MTLFFYQKSLRFFFCCICFLRARWLGVKSTKGHSPVKALETSVLGDACIIIIFSIDTLMIQKYPSHPRQPIKTCSAVPLLVDVDNWQATVDRVGYKIRSGIIPQYLLHYASVCSTPCPCVIIVVKGLLLKRGRDY